MDNIIKILATVSVKEGVGKQSGKPWRALELTFVNGFTKLIFLDSAEWFVVDDLIEADDGKINVKTS